MERVLAGPFGQAIEYDMDKDKGLLDAVMEDENNMNAKVAC